MATAIRDKDILKGQDFVSSLLSEPEAVEATPAPVQADQQANEWVSSLLSEPEPVPTQQPTPQPVTATAEGQQMVSELLSDQPTAQEQAFERATGMRLRPPMRQAVQPGVMDTLGAIVTKPSMKTFRENVQTGKEFAETLAPIGINLIRGSMRGLQQGLGVNEYLDKAKQKIGLAPPPTGEPELRQGGLGTTLEKAAAEGQDIKDRIATEIRKNMGVGWQQAYLAAYGAVEAATQMIALTATAEAIPNLPTSIVNAHIQSGMKLGGINYATTEGTPEDQRAAFIRGFTIGVIPAAGGLVKTDAAAKLLTLAGFEGYDFLSGNMAQFEQEAISAAADNGMDWQSMSADQKLPYRLRTYTIPALLNIGFSLGAKGRGRPDKQAEVATVLKELSADTKINLRDEVAKAVENAIRFEWEPAPRETGYTPSGAPPAGREGAIRKTPDLLYQGVTDITADKTGWWTPDRKYAERMVTVNVRGGRGGANPRIRVARASDVPSDLYVLQENKESVPVSREEYWRQNPQQIDLGDYKLPYREEPVLLPPPAGPIRDRGTLYDSDIALVHRAKVGESLRETLITKVVSTPTAKNTLSPPEAPPEAGQPVKKVPPAPPEGPIAAAPIPSAPPVAQAPVADRGRPQQAGKPPELMTPREFKLADLYDQSAWISDAVQNRRPLGVKAVKEMSKTWPTPFDPDTEMAKQGYVRSGDRYVFKGEVATAQPPEVLAQTTRRDLGKVLNVPEGATFLRATDAEGNESGILEIKKLKTGDNPLRDHSWAKIEFGNKAGKEFRPLSESETSAATRKSELSKMPLEELKKLAGSGGLKSVLVKKVMDAEAAQAETTPDGIQLRKDSTAFKSGALGVIPQNRVGPDPAQQKFDAIRAANQRVGNRTLGRIRDRLVSGWVTVQGPIVRRLQGTTEGKLAADKLIDSLHASAEARRRYDATTKDIESTVIHQNEHMFNDYLLAQRTIELETIARGIKNPYGLTADEARTWIAKAQAEHPDAMRSLEVARQKWENAMMGMVDEAQAEGMLSTGLANYLKTQTKYYPRQFLQHLDPETTGFTSGGRKIQVRESGIKSLDEGSENALLNDWRMLLGRLTTAHTARMFKNRANTALYEVAQQQDNPIGAKIEQPTGQDKYGINTYPAEPPGMTRVYSWQNGQRQAMLMPDEMARYWVTSDPVLNRDAANVLIWITGTKVTKAVATGYNPAFSLRNIARDLVHYWFVPREYNALAPIAAFQQARDLISVAHDAFTGTGAAVDFVRQAGGSDTMTTEGSFFGRQPGEPKGPFREKGANIGSVLSWPGRISELWTRLALRKRAMRNGKTPEEASRIARDAIDFTQGGRYAKALDSVIPYFNAGIQGTRGIFRAFKPGQGRAAWENPAVATAKAAQIVAFSFLLRYASRKFRKDQDDNISDREKETKWIIPLPWGVTDKNGNRQSTYFAVMKDQGQRLFSAIGEALADKVTGGEGSRERLLMALSDMSPIDVSSSPPIPAALLEYALNKDFWTREDIWKGRDVEPPGEYTRLTPEIWRQIGDKTGLSPDRSRNAVAHVIPDNFYTQLLDLLWDTAIGVGDSKLDRTAIEYITKTPMLSGFFRQTRTRPLYEDEEKKAKTLGVATKDEAGNDLAPGILRKRIEAADRKRGSYRQELDVTQDEMMARVTLGTAKFADYQTWLKTLPRAEIDRLAERRKKRWPKVRRE